MGILVRGARLRQYMLPVLRTRLPNMILSIALIQSDPNWHSSFVWDRRPNPSSL